MFAISLTRGLSGIFEPQTLVACGLCAVCSLPDSGARPSTAALPVEAEGILPLGVLTAHGPLCPQGWCSELVTCGAQHSLCSSQHLCVWPQLGELPKGLQIWLLHTQRRKRFGLSCCIPFFTRRIPHRGLSSAVARSQACKGSELCTCGR